MYEIYFVKSGDTIEKIAKMYDTSIGIINQINGFDMLNTLTPGNMVIVPTMRKQPFKYYTVKKGDNMYEIAKKNGIDYDMLLKLNGLEVNDYIYPNQTVMLPKDNLSIYLTNDNDTLDSILTELDINLNDLLKENEKIYLRSEQILFFKKK